MYLFSSSFRVFPDEACLVDMKSETVGALECCVSLLLSGHYQCSKPRSVGSDFLPPWSC